MSYAIEPNWQAAMPGENAKKWWPSSFTGWAGAATTGLDAVLNAHRRRQLGSSCAGPKNLPSEMTTITTRQKLSERDDTNGNA
jgi:hypothetical protein